MAKAIGDTDRAVSTRIRIARLAAGISQGELAQSLGVTFQQVQKYEKGVNRVSAGQLLAIAGALGTTVSALVGDADPTSAAALSMMATRDGSALAAAFNAIDSADDRRALVGLAERMASYSDFYRAFRAKAEAA